MDDCQRCGKRVYPTEKMGPVRDAIFHKQCFKCIKCSQYLTMKTFNTNELDAGDREIYCMTHKPKIVQIDYGADAVGIRRAMYAQTHLKVKKLFFAKHHYLSFVRQAKMKIFAAQQELERQQRKEEDELMEKLWVDRLQDKKGQAKSVLFPAKQTLEDHRLKEGLLIDRSVDKEGYVNSRDLESLQEIGNEQHKEEDELTEKPCILRRKDKKATAQRLTATMVKRHSMQMMDLLKQEQEELHRMIEAEIDEDDVEAVLAEVNMVPKEVPKFYPPTCRKRDLYQDPADFKELDDYVFTVAAKEQTTFTDLVAELIQNCKSDLEKARAIFRWITVKDLNVLAFDEGLEKDTPMGLLRGIKYGTEEYNMLFMRLCSYAGLPCADVEGHSKGVGYEPGMKIREDTFLNTWNVVLVAGNWWPVHCEWGARHVCATEKEDLQYAYNEYYFLTDPDEFIFQHRANDDDKQLLKTPVTLDQFVDTPFVKSIFFNHGLQFERPMKAVLHSDNNGNTEVKIRLSFAKDIEFRPLLLYADARMRTETEFGGAKLARFVFHSIVDDVALFSVQVPEPGSFLLELFVGAFDDDTVKGACGFKIVCEKMISEACPLPDSADAEWGPRRGEQRFGFKALTHVVGIVSVDKGLEMKFQLPHELRFEFQLHTNGIEDSATLEQYVDCIYDDVLTVRVNPPHAGQYRLDIYAQQEDAAGGNTLAHACKYLLNVTRRYKKRTLDLARCRTMFIGPWRR